MQNFGTDMMAGMMTEQAPSPQPQMMPAGRPTPQGGGMPKWFEILMSMLQQQQQPARNAVMDGPMQMPVTIAKNDFEVS